VVGHLMALITLMKGQPLTYNKDNQEDKEPLFDSVDTLADTLRIMAEMVAGLKVKPEAMRAAAMKGYATATDLADHLVRRGVAFRDAHEVVAHAVKLAMQRGVDIAELPLTELRALHPAVDDDARAMLTLQASLQSRATHGGTAPARVREQLERHRKRLA
jgi:argininosuccinate lyase